MNEAFQAVNEFGTAINIIDIVLKFGVVPIIALLWKMNNRIYDMEILIRSNYVTRVEVNELLKTKADKR